jgi:hypothetical protein
MNLYPPFRSLPEEKSGLINLIKLVPVRVNMLEIGAAYGESTEIFAGFFESVFSVDPWEWSLLAEAAFDKMTKRCSNVVKLKGYDNEFLHRVPAGSMDFIYLDGPHDLEGMRKNLRDWIPKLNETGVIGGHDYLLPWGVVQAVDELFGKPDQTFEDSSWFVNLSKRKEVIK